jgi:hypothetical protein
MKKLLLLLLYIPFVISCSYQLLPPTVINKGAVSEYTHFYIQSTETLNSGVTSSDGYGGSYGQQKSVNPSDVITGFLVKRGFIKVLNTDNVSNKTVIVNYGESGKRNVDIFGAYTIEVTIQFVDSKTNTLVSTCVAEGIGSTEADDIRKAITRCLESIF